MTGIARFRRTLNIENSDRGDKQIGDPRVPLNAVEIEDTGRPLLAGTMELGDKTVLWSWDTHGRWELADLVLVSSGTLQLRMLIDTATSASDHTPTGTYNRWYPILNKSCVMSLDFDDDATRIHTTLATDVSSDGNGLPVAFGTSSIVDAYCYKIAAYLPSTAPAPVRWELQLVNRSNVDA